MKPIWFLAFISVAALLLVCAAVFPTTYSPKNIVVIGDSVAYPYSDRFSTYSFPCWTVEMITKKLWTLPLHDGDFEADTVVLIAGTGNLFAGSSQEQINKHLKGLEYITGMRFPFARIITIHPNVIHDIAVQPAAFADGWHMKAAGYRILEAQFPVLKIQSQR